MPRLVTFGCSHTYGYGLSDCYDNTDKPSNFSWPNLLAKKLDRECVNLSLPGSGNLQILMTVLKTRFEPTDLVIVAHSYFNRYEWYKIYDKDGNGNIIKHQTQAHKEILLAELGEKNIEEKQYWYNWLSIQHVSLILNSFNIEYYQFHNVPVGAQTDMPKLLHIPNYWSNMHAIYKDTALDGSHPGIISHQVQTQLLFDQLNG